VSVPATALGPGEALFGSLAEPLSRTPEGRNVLRSAGPVSDAYIQSTADVSLITGPGGSGKTTASVKKALFETVRVHPGPDGLRRYVLGIWRQAYVNLWNATIKSWWKILPEELPGSHWVGSSPRPAVHTIRFRDQWSVSHGSELELVAQFRAFGDDANPEDLLGNECTDAYFNEMSTMPEALVIAMVDRVGRDPPREIIKRSGRMFGDSNAPDVTNFCYRDFYETPKPGYVLFRQPGGLDAGAENIQAMGREYYENSARVNAHRPWWVKRMVHARPGFTRDVKVIYENFDYEVNVSRATLAPLRALPVLVGIDGGFTPAAVYMQEHGDGQLRILGEVALERGAAAELARAMLAYEARRFPNMPGAVAFEFFDTADPSTAAGEEKAGQEGLEEGSFRQKLSAILGRQVHCAATNELSVRISALGDKVDLNLGAGRPGLLIDPSCKVIVRGLSQTFHYRVTKGSNDIAAIAKTPDSHACEAAQYGAMKCGTSEARKRSSALAEDRRARQERSRNARPRDPLARYRG
jgi:hypothetical protein